jgi:hypothetical protein
MTYPVIWAPSGEIIGSATTERGALNVAARVPVLHCEQRTASLRRRCPPDDTWAWFTGPQLIQR